MASRGQLSPPFPLQLSGRGGARTSCPDPTQPGTRSSSAVLGSGAACLPLLRGAPWLLTAVTFLWSTIRGFGPSRAPDTGFLPVVPSWCSVQSLSHVLLFVTPWTAACQASLSITNSRNLLKLTSIEPVMPSNHLILCRPFHPPSIFTSIRVFSDESALRIRWPKYWSFSFNISPSNEPSGLTFLRMDWLDLLAVQGTLKSLPQHHSSKPSVLRHSAFFMVPLSHPYMTTGKTIALTRRTFVGKVVSLLAS